MKPSKAYILRIDTNLSQEYAATCAATCDDVGLEWEYFDGFNHTKLNKGNVWTLVEKEYGHKIPNVRTKGASNGAACATAGHFLIWKKILDNQETAVILEHDAIMIRYPHFDVKDNRLVVLGYKVKDPHNYDADANPGPIELVKRNKHGGAHAYAINHVTAKTFFDQLHNSGKQVTYIDNQYFFGTHLRGQVKMEITDPICALGWLRESTIWPKAAVDNYGPILESFKKNYHSKEDLGVKKG